MEEDDRVSQRLPWERMRSTSESLQYNMQSLPEFNSSMGNSGQHKSLSSYKSMSDVTEKKRGILGLVNKDKLKKHSKSTIQLELDVNGYDDEDSGTLIVTEIRQPGRTPSLLCGFSNLKLKNRNVDTISLVISGVLSRCKEISFEHVANHFRVSIGSVTFHRNLFVPVICSTV
jgi:hypothetical protein